MQRLVLLAEQDPNRVVITDRSPYSAVFYTRSGGGQLLVPIIQRCLSELKIHGVELYTVHVKVDANMLWERICDRLLVEPERALYKENSREWMDEVKGFYDNFPHWSFTVDNSAPQGLPLVVDNLVDALNMRSPMFSETNKRYQPGCSSPLISVDSADWPLST